MKLSLMKIETGSWYTKQIEIWKHAVQAVYGDVFLETPGRAQKTVTLS